MAALQSRHAPSSAARTHLLGRRGRCRCRRWGGQQCYASERVARCRLLLLLLLFATISCSWRWCFCRWSAPTAHSHNFALGQGGLVGLCLRTPGSRIIALIRIMKC